MVCESTHRCSPCVCVLVCMFKWARSENHFLLLVLSFYQVGPQNQIKTWWKFPTELSLKSKDLASLFIDSSRDFECVFVWMPWHLPTTAQIWMSENDLDNFCLSSYSVGISVKLTLPGLTTSIFTHCIIMWASIFEK